jgi:hypothetical protein
VAHHAGLQAGKEAGDAQAAVVRSLLRANARVMVVAHTRCSQLAEWAKGVTLLGGGALLSTHCVGDLVTTLPTRVQPSRHPSLARAREVAAVVEWLASTNPVDMVECVDTEGLCFELANARRLFATTGASSPTSLPLSTPLVVRTYGTAQLQDPTGRAAVGEAKLVYAMEQWVLELADALFVPSSERGRLYARAYQLDSHRILRAPLQPVTIFRGVPNDAVGDAARPATRGERMAANSARDSWSPSVDGGSETDGAGGGDFAPPAAPSATSAQMAPYLTRFSPQFVRNNLHRPLALLSDFLAREIGAFDSPASAASDASVGVLSRLGYKNAPP